MTRCEDAAVHFKVKNGRLYAKNFERISPDLREEIRRREEELIRELDPRTEVWVFRKLHIPSQLEPGFVDVWMIGEPEDRPGDWCCWFIRKNGGEI
jgi:hypothetical protein